MNNVAERPKRVYPGKYIYGLWMIKFDPKQRSWLTYPPYDNNVIDFDCEKKATKAAPTLIEAVSFIDYGTAHED